MNAESRPIVVGFDGSTECDHALRWAIDEARSTGRALRVVIAYEYHVTHPWLLTYTEEFREDGGIRQHFEKLVDRRIAEVRRVAPDLTVDGTSILGDIGRVLRGASPRSSLLVLGHRDRGPLLSALLGPPAPVSGSTCPVVMLPEGSTDRGEGVVAGVDGGRNSQTVLDFAFDYASRHRQKLFVVMCRPPLSRRLDANGNGAIENAERWLAETTTGLSARYPDVAIVPTVVPDHAVDGLVRAAQDRQLLVVGIDRPHHMLGTVVTGVLSHAPCPVAAVPATSNSHMNNG
jgi:nucleotide-binding universal stress UspA family protein